MRGYYDYEYDVKTKALTNKGNGVCSENGIGFYEAYYDDEELKTDLEKGVLRFRESPSEHPDEIKEQIEEAIDRMKRHSK
jgi:hypothetical protein